jgi:large subunit ribosomal protein L2
MAKGIIGAIKYYKPTTPGRRGKRSISRYGLHRGSSLGGLTYSIKKTGTRNNHGRLTASGRSGKNQHRRKFRVVDFSRKLQDIWGKVKRIEYDPNRSAFIALVSYKPTDDLRRKITEGAQTNAWKCYYYDRKKDLIYGYILATDKMRVGHEVISCDKFSVDLTDGSSLLLGEIPIGKSVHNIETRPNSRKFFVRGAGCFGLVVGKEGGYVIVKLPSTTLMRIHGDCRAVLGRVSNENHNQIKLGKAGSSKHRGRSSTVRGHAMNPVDHKMGGRKSGQINPTNFRGHMRKGQITRNKKKNTSKRIISGRRKRNG